MTTVYVSFDKELFFENETKAFEYWEQNVNDCNFYCWLDDNYTANEIYYMDDTEKCKLKDIYDEFVKTDFDDWLNDGHFLAFDIY